jgi:hypothetical protein
MGSILIELHYLPSIAYFSMLAHSEKIIIERHEHYLKQSYRNRFQILGANGVQQLTIPVTGKHGNVTITDVHIDYSQKWMNNHWRSITSAYRKAPFFEHYADELNRVLMKKQPFLYDLSFELLTICLKWLRLEIPMVETSAYEIAPAEGISDLRNRLLVKKPETHQLSYTPQPYTQMFGKTFVKNLSVIDLIFCEGPGARQLVQGSSQLR